MSVLILVRLFNSLCFFLEFFVSFVCSFMCVMGVCKLCEMVVRICMCFLIKWVMCWCMVLNVCVVWVSLVGLFLFSGGVWVLGLSVLVVLVNVISGWIDRCIVN